jgi:hypothetical protein
MFYIIIGISLGIIIQKFISSNASPSNPSILDIEKSYKNHKTRGPISTYPPIMYQRQQYIDLYHDKMIEFINEMMIIENDGFNPLLMSLH